MIITLKNLHEATAQQVFTQVATHLLKQKERSFIIDDEGEELCAYRGDNGLMCAAGSLISDDEYIPIMDRLKTTWRGLINKGYVRTYAHSSFITELQTIHDNSAVHEWAGELEKFALRHKLEMPTI